MSLSVDRPSQSRYERLESYLESDPENLGLMTEAADAAMEEGHLTRVTELVERHARIAPPPPSLLNLLGLVAIAEGRFDEAAAIFASVVMGGSQDVGAKFNLAWSRGMIGDDTGALEMLDPDVLERIPAAAALRVHSLHRTAKLDEALTEGDALAQNRDDPDLMGALALVALDAEDMARARLWASKAPRNPDGLSTLGMLSLSDNQAGMALASFDAALALQSDSARSLLGKGLALLSLGDAAAGAGYIDRGAEAFGDHPGSWVAAGWAHFVAGDHAGASSRFEKALSLDDAFAESHGALAVLDAVEGRIDDARQRARTALRLDRASLSGALAQSLILVHDGDPGAAARVREAALNAPLGPNGRTIAEAMAGLGLSARGSPRA